MLFTRSNTYLQVFVSVVTLYAPMVYVRLQLIEFRGGTNWNVGRSFLRKEMYRWWEFWGHSFRNLSSGKFLRHILRNQSSAVCGATASAWLIWRTWWRASGRARGPAAAATRWRTTARPTPTPWSARCSTSELSAGCWLDRSRLIRKRNEATTLSSIVYNMYQLDCVSFVSRLLTELAAWCSIYQTGFGQNKLTLLL